VAAAFLNPVAPVPPAIEKPIEAPKEIIQPVVAEVPPVEEPKIVAPNATALRPPARPFLSSNRQEVKPPQPVKKAEAKQETLQFEPASRGRFEKSEPTIIDGQDLDVPTFLRKNVKIK
jgi:cell division protein FtsZ